MKTTPKEIEKPIKPETAPPQLLGAAFVPQPFIRIGVYELSGTPTRHGETVQLMLPKRCMGAMHIGTLGMPTYRDYDLVIKTTSLLAQSYKSKKRKADRDFTVPVSDILNFCCRANNPREAAEVESSLQRLTETKLTIDYPIHEVPYSWEAEGFIQDYKVLERSECGAPKIIHIQAATWMYDLIVMSRGKQARLLNSDYFKITTGIGRFIYLTGCTANGGNMKKWDFGELYINSNSTMPRKVFWQKIREEVKKGIPGFESKIISGGHRPALMMRRTFDEALKSYK